MPDQEQRVQELDQLYSDLKDRICADIDHSSKWRKTAKDEFAFVAGGEGQWEAEAISLLRDEQRPIVTFNKTLKFVRAICGIEANNRHETIFLPSDVTEPGEVQANEVLSAGSEWMNRTARADRHQSRAFRDAVICGMGWTEATVDFDEDPRGKYVETRCNPLEMGWDWQAREANLSDAKRRWRARKMLVSEARELIEGINPDEQFSDEDLDAFWASSVTSGRDPKPKTQEQKELRAENTTFRADDRREVTIMQVQWWEYEPYYRALDVSTMQTRDMSEEEFRQRNAEFMRMETPGLGGGLPHVRLRRKAFKQAFLGGRVLHVGPCPNPNGFTFNCITYEPDDNDGTWYGLVRVLRDPQVWHNKFFSQLMHITNSTAKGGIIAEEDAFPDVNEARTTYARPNAVTIVSKGAIGKGKIMAKPGAGITSGVLQLLQIADRSFSETSGINLELMGLADREQAGVLEAQRKQAAMTILATLFDSLQQFRQDVGRCRLHYLQTVFADGRLVRVYGDEGWQAIPLIRDKMLGHYDVIINDAPTSPNAKEKAWAALMMVLPAFREMITPEVAVLLLDYAPGIPQKLVNALKEIAQRPDEDAERQKQLAITSAVEELKKTRSETQKNVAASVLDMANAAVKEVEATKGRLEAIVQSLMVSGAPMIDATAADEAVIGPRADQPPQPGILPELGGPVEDAEITQPQPEPVAADGLMLPGGLNGGML